LPHLVGVIYVGVGCCTMYKYQLMLFSCIRIALLSPRGSSIGCEPCFMKRSSQVRIPPPLTLAWTCQKKKKNCIILFKKKKKKKLHYSESILLNALFFFYYYFFLCIWKVHSRPRWKHECILIGKIISEICCYKNRIFP
jgi:hypothetical protein